MSMNNQAFLQLLWIKGRGGGTGPMNTRDTFMGDDGEILLQIF